MLAPHKREAGADTGDKVREARRRLQNFATLVLQRNRLIVCLYLDPTSVGPLPASARDVTSIGHWGTGDLELSISCADELEAAKPLLQRAYLGRGPVS